MTLNSAFASLAPVGTHFHFRLRSGMTSAMVTDEASEAEQRRGELVALIRSVGNGDHGALSSLYSRTSAKLYGICIRLLGNGPDAEDVLQDVYVTIWRKADRFDEGKASPITWLAVIARNKAIDRLRSKRPGAATIDEASEVADEGPSAVELIEQDQNRSRLMGCLDELDERPRAMIRSAFLDGASYPQLAERESVPLGTMKSWIRRGLKQLRKCLER